VRTAAGRAAEANQKTDEYGDWIGLGVRVDRLDEPPGQPPEGGRPRRLRPLGRGGACD
jgi:hypothetical protein